MIGHVSTAPLALSGRKPGLNLAPRDVTGLKQKLRTYQRTFAALFKRQEQRHWSQKYLAGQMLEIERKLIEPMAQALEDGNIQARQQFISAGAWSDAEVIETHQGAVARTLGRPDGMLILDGCDFPKQGEDSVGVARQHCGPLGKIANCQASVVLAHASEAGHTLLDRRLYLPKDWFEADHRERWVKCGIPDDVSFQTKPQLGWEMVEAILHTGRVPFQWVAMDEGSGSATHLLNHIHSANKYFFAKIARTTRAWRYRPKGVPPGPPPVLATYPIRSRKSCQKLSYEVTANTRDEVAVTLVYAPPIPLTRKKTNVAARLHLRKLSWFCCLVTAACSCELPCITERPGWSASVSLFTQRTAAAISEGICPYQGGELGLSSVLPDPEVFPQSADRLRHKCREA